MIKKSRFHHKDTKNTKVRNGGVTFRHERILSPQPQSTFFRKRSYNRTKSEFNTNWSTQVPTSQKSPQYNFGLQTLVPFVSLW